MQMAKLEPPSVLLAAGVLANRAIKPALQAARQSKVPAVDCQHERVVEDLQAWVESGAKASTSDPGTATVLPAKRQAVGLPARVHSGRR